MTIALNKPVSPDINKLTKYLEKVNDSGWYTNFGPLHQELTQRLEAYLGVQNLLLVSNGTLALQVACKVLGINKAISTPFSFVATSSALLWQGIGVDYADIDEGSLNLCPKKVEECLELENGYDGVVATHVYGNPCAVEEFERIAAQQNVKVLYDAAHAFGVNVNNQSVLNYGDASTLSFHATKVFHTVEGGAIVFKRREDYLKAKELINFGINADGGLGEPGINAKLNEYQCAVGLTILDSVEDILSKRISLYQYFQDALKDYVGFPKWHDEASLNGAYMPLLLKDSEQKKRVKQALAAQNIQCRDYFSPSLNEVYKPEQLMPISEEVTKKVLCLPLHYHISVENVESISDVVIGAIKE